MGTNDKKTGLVDISIARVILKKSRRTIFYLVKLGKLTPHKIKGTRKTWFEVAQLIGLSQVKPAPARDRLSRHLHRFHPRLFMPPEPGLEPEPDGHDGHATA